LTQVFISLITTAASKGSLEIPLSQLRGRLGLARRFIRLFRFLDSFHAAYTLISQPQSLTTETYLDVLANTFNGLYFLLEAITMVEALQIDNFTIWTPEYEKTLKIESQRCWFLALVCGAIASGLRLSMARRELVTQSARLVNGSESQEKHERGSQLQKRSKIEKQGKEREKKRGLEKAARAHLRKLVSNVLDLPLPGSVIGWIHAEPLTLGLAMTITSVLTGYDVWERCGRE
jgi:hypothetical protein